MDKIKNRKVILNYIFLLKEKFKIVIVLNGYDEKILEKFCKMNDGEYCWLLREKKFLKLFERLEIDKQSGGYNEAYSLFVEEYTYLKSVIKERELDQEVWKEVVRTCKSKIIDFERDRFLYHGTKADWNRYEVENFVKVGILSPSSAGKIGKGAGTSLAPHHISLISSGVEISPWGVINFIINPEYVAKNRSEFIFDPYAHGPFVGEKRLGASTFAHGEVLGPGNIPFNEIIGIFILGNHLGKIRYLMTKLVSIDPKLVFPIYDVKGNVLWPSLK